MLKYRFTKEKIDKVKKGRVEKKIQKELKNIRREYKTPTGRKYLKMQDTERKLPCISHSCKFEGVRLKRYLGSKCHNLSENDPEMAESYMLHKIKNVCMLSGTTCTKPRKT